MVPFDFLKVKYMVIITKEKGLWQITKFYNVNLVIFFSYLKEFREKCQIVLNKLKKCANSLIVILNVFE